MLMAELVLLFLWHPTVWGLIRLSATVSDWIFLDRPWNLAVALSQFLSTDGIEEQKKHRRISEVAAQYCGSGKQPYT